MLAWTAASRGEHFFNENPDQPIFIWTTGAWLIHDHLATAARVAATLKHAPLRLTAARPVAEAISTAGGVRLEALDPQLMLKALPGVFCAGEMLDWEAPTGGYLLTASMASGRIAGAGAAAWLRSGWPD